MSSNVHAPIGRANPSPDGPEAPREAGERKREEHEQDAWALAITQALLEVRPKLALPSSPEPADAAAAPAAAQSVEIATLASSEAAAAAGSEAAAPGGEAAPSGPPLPTRVIAELSDSRLGRVEVSVARGAKGLRIVINVADAHVKALIESEQATLWKSLQGCGLRVDSLEIGQQLAPGIALAPEQVAQERALARSRGNPSLRSANARWRGYGAAPEEEPEDDTERVDLTA